MEYKEIWHVVQYFGRGRLQSNQKFENLRRKRNNSPSYNITHSGGAIMCRAYAIITKENMNGRN